MTTVIFSVLLLILGASGQQFWASEVQAWIYPGNPACSAKSEYSDGRKIHVLKPEYFTVNAAGVIELIEEFSSDLDSSCNGYSVQNLESIKSFSLYQYATVSGAGSNFATMMASANSRTIAVNTLVQFCVTSGITGVELDFESFGSWSSTMYQNYKLFVTQLGNSLHAQSKKLMIDGPPIGSATEQTYYQFKYEDFVNMPIDFMVVMAYDYQFDYGCGAAVQPLNWLTNICDWVKTKFPDTDRIVMGIPSYGYSGAVNSYNPRIMTKKQATTVTNWSNAPMDSASGERTWTANSNVYYYVDSTGLNMKRNIIESKGIKHVSVWHLGGNDWFTGKNENYDVNVMENDVAGPPATTQTKVQTSQAQTTVAQTTKAQTTVAQTTQVQTTVAQTTKAQTSQAQTTVAQTTKATTIAQTTKATTVAQTTKATTVAQTTKATTVAQTTKAQTSQAQTTVAQTTKAQTTQAQTTVAQTTQPQTPLTCANDCANFPNSICVSGSCVCRDGWSWSNTRTRSIPLPGTCVGSACAYDENCSGGSKCFSGMCGCPTGTSWNSACSRCA